MKIGERIKELRLEREWTLKQFGKKIGVSEATAQRYESGKVKNISPEMVSKIAQALGTSAAWLLGEKEDQPTAAVSVQLSQTEHLLIRLYRDFSPEEKNTVRSVILTINELRGKAFIAERELAFAEEFIDGTEYSSDYRKGKEESTLDE